MLSVKVSGSLAEIRAGVEALASPKLRQGFAFAINHTLGKTETQVNRALVKQTGLKYSTIKAAMKRYSASAGTLKGEIVGRGSHTTLGQFGPRQTSKGVSAAPWGERQIFEGTFMVARYGGEVFRRTGSSRFPIKKLYGPAIPKEMVKDEAEAAFHRTVASELPSRVNHELSRLIGG